MLFNATDIKFKKYFKRIKYTSCNSIVQHYKHQGSENTTPSIEVELAERAENPASNNKETSNQQLQVIKIYISKTVLMYSKSCDVIYLERFCSAAVADSRRKSRRNTRSEIDTKQFTELSQAIHG